MISFSHDNNMQKNIMITKFYKNRKSILQQRDVQRRSFFLFAKQLEDVPTDKTRGKSDYVKAANLSFMRKKKHMHHVK